MYIKIGETQYPCTRYKPLSGIRAIFYGVTGLALPASGTVTLCRNDGFELANVDAEDYARQTYENGILTLTNEPESVVETAEPEVQPKKGLFSSLRSLWKQNKR